MNTARPAWDRAQVRARFEHLADRPDQVCVPINGEWSTSFRLDAGEVKVRPADLVASGYLVALTLPGAHTQLVGLEYLAHERPTCTDPVCWAVWQDRADEAAEIPADAMLFARTEVSADDLGEASYLFHADDFERIDTANTSGKATK